MHAGKKITAMDGFVRNLLDHAIMRQADRLIREHQNGTLGKERRPVFDGGRFRDDRPEKETAEPADRILCRVNSIKISKKIKPAVKCRKRKRVIQYIHEDCGSAKHVAIWYQRGQKPFAPNIYT